MKIFARAIALCACFLGFHAIDLLTTKILKLEAVRFHIPAPAFSLDEVIHAASRKHNVPAALIKSIIAAESNFSPRAISPKGAIGLMQLMPATARQLGADPTKPEQNVDAGTNYLSWLLRRYAQKKNGMRVAIAAYNAGPGTVERYRGLPPYRETRAYVSRVLGLYAKYQRQESGVSQRGLLAASLISPNSQHCTPDAASRDHAC